MKGVPLAVRARRALQRLPRLLLFALVLLFLLAPIVVVAGGSFSRPETGGLVISYVEFPPKRLTLDWYRRIPPEHLQGLLLSLALAATAALGACVIGVPAAFGLVRGQFAGKAVAAALFRAPLQIPAVVSGIAFLQLFNLLGDLLGIELAGSFPGLALAHVFLATPFVIGSVGAVLQRFNPRLEEAALSLGASRWRVLRRVTLPLIMPGIFTGALYGFIVSFVDVPVSMFLATPGTVTYPVELFYAMEHDFSPTILASATLTMAGALLLLLIAQRVVGLERLARANG
jgi:putative spermidine/putrescine transport system permease protein